MLNNRVDVFDKVTGKAKYAGDMYFPGMLHGKTVRCPFPHARINKIDSKEAEKLPGVVKVVTASDVPGILSQPKQKPMLVGDICRYAGEGVAVVFAETQEIAEEGAKLVEVFYDELPAVLTPQQALAGDAPLIYPDGNLLIKYKTCKGDIDKGFAEADKIFEREYSSQREDHATIEPEAVVAVPGNEGLTIYVPTNSLYNVRQTIAEALGVGENGVRIILPVIGGSFGAKNYDMCVMASRAALGAKYTGRPCKMVYTREESIIEGTKRHPYTMRYKAGVKNDGSITAVKLEILGDGGAYTSKSFPVASRSAIEGAGPYNIENTLTNVTFMYTNNAYSDAMRGFGSPQVDFASEVLWDEIAHELGMTPLEFKRKNHLRDKDISPVGQILDDVTLDECLEAALKQIPYEERSKEIEEWNKNNMYIKRGLGVALMHRGEAFGAAGQGLDTAAVSISTGWDGTVTIMSSVAEVGMGGHTALVNIVHEVLGIDRSLIRVSRADSDYSPNSGPTVATRGALVPGNAVFKAALQLRDRYAEIAIEKLGIEKLGTNELVFKDNKIFARSHPEKFISYIDAVKENYARGDNGYGHGWYTIDGLDWNKAEGTGDAYLCYVFGACIAEVEVNIGTGQVTVRDFTQVHDVGHAFDMDEAVGQINGGAVMGIGYGLFEDIEMKDGRIKSANFDKYLIPTAMDIPRLKPVVLEIPGRHGPFGAKGMGEPTACPAAPAIINAIAEATGAYVRNIPASLERVLEAVHI